MVLENYFWASGIRILRQCAMKSLFDFADFSEILTFLKDTKILVNKWPELLNHSHTNREIQLDQFLLQMWKELFTLRGNVEIPCRIIGLSHLILPKYATSKKSSSLTRYVQGFEKWIVPFIKDAIDKG